LYIHGGPYGAFGSTYVIDFDLLVGVGYAVVFHNFRGSSGYGTQFRAKIAGQWGTAGSLDHHAALDAAVGAGIADPDRLGVCGLSHGGFATCWLLGTSERFRAGVAENQNVDRASSFGVGDGPEWIAEEFGRMPWQAPELYREQSPLTYAPRCSTPLLLIVGEEDYRCHATQSEQYYRVLKGNGTQTEMLRLPGSAHTGSIDGPLTSRIAQNEAMLDWFDRYL
jgi:dipeptidyl aminopeptidase/acylaminoacyl peptidase